MKIKHEKKTRNEHGSKQKRTNGYLTKRKKKLQPQRRVSKRETVAHGMTEKVHRSILCVFFFSSFRSNCIHTASKRLRTVTIIMCVATDADAVAAVNLASVCVCVYVYDEKCNCN